MNSNFFGLPDILGILAGLSKIQGMDIPPGMNWISA
jgi:hypothetical protein